MLNGDFDSLPLLTEDQLRAHEQFAWMETSIEQLCHLCRSVMKFKFDATERRFRSHFQIPEPGILISKRRIENALMRKRLGIVSERELVLWGTMILLNDAYEIGSTDEDLIAEWLNDFSFELDSTDDEKR